MWTVAEEGGVGVGGGEALIGLRLSRAGERGWAVPGNVFVKECPIVFGSNLKS